MTIEERLEKLTERHEALTQTVEMLIGDVRTLATASEAQRISIAEHRRKRLGAQPWRQGKPGRPPSR